MSFTTARAVGSRLTPLLHSGSWRMSTRRMHGGASASANNGNGNGAGGGAYAPKYSNGPVKNNINKKRPSGKVPNPSTSKRRRDPDGPKLSPGAGSEPPKAEFGPPLPPWQGGPDPDGMFTGTPDWAKLLQEEALHDEDVAKMIEGCDGDPKKIYAQIKQRFDARSEEIMRESAGREEGMKVKFREFDPVNLWIWLELYEYPLENERKLLEEVVDAWYTLGHLGGFNTLNMQVTEQGEGVSYMKYDVKEGVDTSQFALFHNMEEVEYKANWARFWVDMGTADEMALDVLINSLMQLSREYVGIKSAIIGGINEDWKEDTEGKQGGDLLMRLGMAPARRGETDFLDRMPSEM